LTLQKSHVNSRKGPDQIETQRLLLRKPLIEDVDSIFSRYASDPAVTRYMSWPLHRSVADTKAFLAWSDADWAQWPAGSYLVFERDSLGRLLGGTGLTFVSLEHALTGYVFAHDAWGFGFATESMKAMVGLARSLGVRRLEAVCHVDHRASARVLEKCGFMSEGVVPAHTEFVNLNAGIKSDVLSFVHHFPG
jgi:ribosomal-protein-alanine N-acetyltransferase